MNTEEIKKAIEELGYEDFTYEIAASSAHRAVVYVDGEWLGIYDFDKHTFVD